MADFNLTRPLTFVLMGIPGLAAAHVWISIPFCLCYLTGLLGNLTVVCVVGKEEALHKPMYLLLCLLALTDMAMPSSVVPRALWLLWFNAKGVTVGGCLAQMFFIHALAVMQSAVLVTMALDRYVAICSPLRYTTILSNARIATLGLVALLRAVVFILPIPLLLSRQPFCASRLVPHTYCEHMAVVKLSCGDTTVNRVYGLAIAFVITGLDLTLILLSYGLIMRAVLRMSSRNGHRRALSTCTAHLCVVMMFYTPSLFSYLTHRFGQSIPPHVPVFSANLYLLVPPMLNPIIYGVKTKELRDKVGKYTCRVWSGGAAGIKRS